MQIEGLIRLLKNLLWLLTPLLIFMIFFEDQLSIPTWLFPIGRLHPMVLHFPIVLVFLLAIWTLIAKSQEDSYRSFGVLVTVHFVIVTSIMGLFLSLEDAELSDLMFKHKWSALVLTALMIISTGVRRTISNVLIVLALPIVILVGHFGGSLTHGENFVFESWQDEENTGIDQPVFQAYIKPIINNKCAGCHNPNKKKGDLDLSSFSTMVMGGENGEIWNLSEPDSSLLLKNILLPLAHDDHMPPEGKDQLTDLEINLLSAWIKSGVDTSSSIFNLSQTHLLFEPVNSLVEYLGQNNSTYHFDYAEHEVVNNLNNSFRSVELLYPGSPALEASFFVRSAFSIDDLKELLVVKDQLISLNLSYMPVDDDDLEIISQFQHLERLNLNFTEVNGKGFGYLGNLKSLKSLSLAGTSVTESSLTSFSNLNELDVYLWQEASTDTQNKLPESIKVHYGYNVADEAPIALTPPVLDNDRIIGSNEKMGLSHSFSGAEIRYSLDSSVPDSTSTLYTEPIEIKDVTKVRAIAMKTGWLQSKEVNFEVYKAGIVPDSMSLLTSPGQKYRGKLAQTLVDQEKGEISDFGSGMWLGYEQNAMELWVDFGDQKISQMILSYGVNIGSYIMPPEKVEIWTSEDNVNFKRLHAKYIAQPIDYEPSYESHIRFNLSSSKFVRIKVFPVKKLPSWHNGKGEKGWAFVDELFFYN